MKNYIFIMFIFATLPAAANPCHNMYKRICTGDLKKPDSTGYSLGNQQQTLTEELINENRQQIFAGAEKLFAQLKKANSTSFNQALGSEYSQCKDQTLANYNSECTELALRSLRKFVVSKVSKNLNYSSANFRKKFPWLVSEVPLNFDLIKATDYKKISLSIVADIKKNANQSPQVKEFAEKIFKPTQRQILQMLPALISEPQFLQKAQKDVANMTFGGTNCETKKHQPLHIDTFASNDAIFNPELNKVFICYGRLQATTSAYSLAALVAHEISHSFDPCNITDPGIKDFSHFFPTTDKKWTPRAASAWSYEIYQAEHRSGYRKLLRCLRDKKSAEIYSLTSMHDKSRKYSVLCSDQAPEAFADWFAVEVIAQMIKKNSFKANDPADRKAGIDNIFRALCGNGEPAVLGAHKPNWVRVDKILAAHPYIRETLGCPPLPANLRYCDFLDDSQLPAANSLPQENSTEK